MKTLKITILLLAVFTICACQKENTNRLIIETEPLNGSKLAVYDNHSFWAEGDHILINGQDFPIQIQNDGQVSVDLTGHTLTAPFCGIYPSSLSPSISGNYYTFNLPHSYTYSTCATRLNGSDAIIQNLQSPMLAYRNDENDNHLLFKHLTAAITVEITNNFGFAINVTNVTISSNNYQLSGSCNVDITDIENNVSAVTTNTEADRQVAMTFTSTQLNIASGGTSRVQLPVLPVGNDNRFTISVTVQSTDGTKTYTFSKTQGDNSSDGYALLRAQIGYAPAKFGGVFTVDNQGTTVRFAPGNLQYKPSTNEWRIAPNQYDRILNYNSNISSSYDNWIDLFGWGTSGWNNGNTYYRPYDTDHSNGAGALYGPAGGYDLTGAYLNCDWGYQNTISPTNASGRWRTLSADEWQYLLDSRTTHKIGKGSVNGITGLILLPDEFIDPMKNNGNGAFQGVYNAPSSYSNTYSAEDWVAMEAAGAIFLPETGQRVGTTINETTTGYYWTSTHESTDQAKTLWFHVNGYGVGQAPRYRGQAVRLVRVYEQNY